MVGLYHSLFQLSSHLSLEMQISLLHLRLIHRLENVTYTDSWQQMIPQSRNKTENRRRIMAD